MDTITSKDVEDLSDTNCFIRTDERNRKNETTHPELRNSRVNCEVSPVYDLVKQSREKSLKLLDIKRKQKRKKDIEQGKIFIKSSDFSRYY